MTTQINGPMTIKKFEIPKSDDDYAQQFLRAQGSRLRFCPDLKLWLHFSRENGWVRDETNMAYHFLLEFARGTVVVGLEEAKHRDDQKQFTSLLCRLKDCRRLDPALALASKDPSVVVRALALDQQPELIGCLNGTLNVLTGEFDEFSPGELVTRRLKVVYDPSATAPTWQRFLEEVQPDQEMRSFLQRLLGYSLFGAIRDHVLPFHYGTGANGKSTALEGLLRLFGDYGAKLTNSLVYMTRNGASPHLELAGLFGTRLALGEENAQGGSLNEELLKALTGGDRVKGRFHYSNFVEAPATYKIHLVGNHKPGINGTDDGIWRRFVLVPWPVSISPDKRDPQLPERIAQESAGLLNWLLQGCKEWHETGLRIPKCCKAATDDFRLESDEIADFINECLEKDHERYTLKAEVYEVYRRWAESGGLRPVTRKKLSLALQERGFDSGRTSTTRDHLWTGWSLKAR